MSIVEPLLIFYCIIYCFGFVLFLIRSNRYPIKTRGRRLVLWLNFFAFMHLLSLSIVQLVAAKGVNVSCYCIISLVIYSLYFFQHLILLFFFLSFFSFLFFSFSKSYFMEFCIIYGDMGNSNFLSSPFSFCFSLVF